VQSAIRTPGHGNQTSSRNRQQPTAIAEAPTITRAVLRPTNGSAEARWAEIVGVENLFDKNAERPLERAEDVVHGDNGSIGETGLEHGDICFRPFVGVVAVNPEKPKRVLPFARELVRVRALDLDALDDTGCPEVGDEVFVLRRLAAEVRVRGGRRGVRNNGDDGTQSQLARHVCNSHRRSALEASDFEILSPRWRQRGCGHHQARLALGEIARRSRNATPPLVDDCRDMVEVVLWRQNSS
jgi:hypothetical protein